LNILPAAVAQELGIDVDRDFLQCKTAAGSLSATLTGLCHFCRIPDHRESIAEFVIPDGFQRWSFKKEENILGDQRVTHAGAHWTSAEPKVGKITLWVHAYFPIGVATVTVSDVLAIRSNVIQRVRTKWHEISLNNSSGA
jgi:hypothetical protein